MSDITRLPGPIMIFGAGGFVGINLFQRLLAIRPDIVGITSDLNHSWRIKNQHIPVKNLRQCNLLAEKEIKDTIRKYKPQTIFNLAAYGAYPTQTDTDRIYRTNFHSTVNLIEALKKTGFSRYVHAGSQSEYGLNCRQPKETAELAPNSHYAISKTAVYYLLKYYGQLEKLPVAHLRLYSVYGPWEEPDRLIPTLLRAAKKGRYPSFVNAQISRDFIYVDDTVDAMITVASRLEKREYGEAFNIATGRKITIRQLAYLVKKLFKLKGEPQFGSMKNRNWDLTDWVGNPGKMKKVFGWKAKVSLSDGLIKTFNYETSS